MKRTLSYDRARSILLLAGLILIALVALIALSRGVDAIEVAGTLLFIPVFAGFLFFGVRGGLVVSLGASIGYVLLRIPSIRLVGLEPLSGQIATRIIGYLGFGLGGGWASREIKATLEKLALYDDIDDETGLGNARSMVETTDVEMARADRYQKVFSVVLADLNSPDWSSIPARKERAALRAIGTKLKAAVRSSDHAAHARRGDHHLFGLVLPETGPEGARIVATNLQQSLTQHAPDDRIRLVSATYPGDDDALKGIIDLFSEIDRLSRPADESKGRP